MNALKLAIIGGGPSAFYVASRILKLLPSTELRVHVFDRLWAPHGLVRYGVAPDHPEVKNCTHKFDTTAQDSRFRFFGNVDIGDTAHTIPYTLRLPLSSIFDNYSHVVFATGCTLPTLHGALPPSPYCIPALSLVHWYTQYPDTPPPPPLDKVSHVSIIGNGNVSLDVARMLLTNVKVLSQYDVPQHVLDLLSRSNVKHVSIIGRRGPLEAAFTMKELREMINLPEASMVPLNPSLLTTPPSNPPLTRQQSRVLQLLQRGSKNQPGTTSKSWSLHFFRSPIGLVPPSADSSARLSLSHTTLDPHTNRAVPTGETSILSTDLVITSLGFHGEPTANFYDPGLGHLRTVSSRIITSSGTILKNVYASGWAATGAKGVLASTMMDAYGVADTVISDWQSNAKEDGQNRILNLEVPPQEVLKALKEGLVTEYADWKKIDEEEVRRGGVIGKERERMSWFEAR
ncbi:ferredoxin/adrenodoxin reductase [Phlegmacium glaucopus]|nr:ferredoxin/adrenodoxin reductase [Phlegmacium glaucopus]